MKAVRFHQFGGIDVLNVENGARPSPQAGEVLVQVKAAGINPGESKIREGLLENMFPTILPCGEGTDFAGIITAVGADVVPFAAGDEVTGFTHKRASHAEYVVVPTNQLAFRPANVPWEAAGTLAVAGTTAYAAIKSVRLVSGDTLVVANTAGGVGSIAVQLGVHTGAKVIGLASAQNHPWLADHGVIPVAYGDDAEERIRAAAGGPIDAFIDAFGANYVEMALALGVRPERIDTIVNFGAVSKHGVRAEGGSSVISGATLAELAGLLSQGKLDIPIAHTFPLLEVRAAFRELEKGHILGKIVLVP